MSASARAAGTLHAEWNASNADNLGMVLGLMSMLCAAPVQQAEAGGIEVSICRDPVGSVHVQHQRICPIQRNSALPVYH